MLKALYNLAVFILALVWLPKLFKGKYKSSIKERLGLTLPKIDTTKPGPLIWIHAVSVGETKAAAALAAELRKNDPTVRLAISSVTETGHMEAKRSIPNAEAYFFLPLDFSWLMRRLLKTLKPAAVILMESEFWYNLLDEAKKMGCRTALVNGKLSERSSRRFSKVPWFTKPLFANIDLLCVQTDEYKEAFQALQIPSEKIIVTGNLKFDIKPPQFSQEEKREWQERLGISQQDFVIVLGSTHEGEESALIASLKPLFERIPNLKVLLVPRHPHRFDRVAEILSEQGIAFNRFSSDIPIQAPIVLIDTMGKLMACFQIAHVGVVCGCFIPGIGGHNLFEPAACGLPVIFGPYTEAQQAYADALLASQGGMALKAEKVGEKVLELYENASLRTSMGKKALTLVQRSMGAAKKTVEVLVAKSIA